MLWFVFYSTFELVLLGSRSVSSQPSGDIKCATELPGNFYFLSVNYMLLNTLIWLLIHLL